MVQQGMNMAINSEFMKKFFVFLFLYLSLIKGKSKAVLCVMKYHAMKT